MITVTYRFREDSFETFPPFTQQYEHDIHLETFIRHSIIFLYEYVNDCSPCIPIIPTQFLLYTKNGMTVETVEEEIVVYITNPIQTINYKETDYYEHYKKTHPPAHLHYFWITVPYKICPHPHVNQPYELNELLLHGISYENGELTKHVVEFSVQDYQRYKKQMTHDCKKRLAFLINHTSGN
jgi:hypothetical protein